MNNDELKAMLDLSGGAEALRLAFVVFVKMQPKEFQNQFIAAYKNEVIAWRELAYATPNPDSWIESFESRANRLVQLMQE
jgi:hypothetical protein